MTSTEPHDARWATCLLCSICLFVFVLCCVVWRRAALCSHQAGLKLPETLLLEPPTCWAHRYESPRQTVLFCFVCGVLGIELKGSVTEPHALDQFLFILRQDLSKLPRLVSISQSSCLSLSSGGFGMKEELRGVSIECSAGTDKILDSDPSAEKNQPQPLG